MEDEISVKPLVDVLSEQLGEQVVMSGGSYVYYSGFLPVDQNDIDIASLEQSSMFLLDNKNMQKNIILNEFNKAVAKLSDVTPHEMTSWRKQEEQSRAYVADNSVVTPMLDAIIESRGLSESKVDFATLVIDYADAYEASYGALLGKYQKLSKIITKATTVNAVKLASWTT